ncbi:hypothetical protein BVH42_03840 [Campylobacter lari]|nr:hypothetical protein [Campylobacter lari]
MELSKIVIKNFRSIEDITINISKINDSRCLILLGKNEAGKSNILKAISAVFGNYRVSAKDQRKERSGENIQKEDYYIDAIFTLNNSDFKIIETKFKNTFKNTNLIQFDNHQTLLEFIKKYFKKILLNINIDDNQEVNMLYYSIEEKINFKESIQLVGEEFQICENEESHLTIETLADQIFDCICEIWDLRKIYICHNWEFNEEYILPSEVNIEDFKNNPDICKPLKNLFILGGKSEIQFNIEKYLKQDDDIHNLLDNVSEEATNKFRNMWSDLDKIKFSLLPNGDKIQIFIEDYKKFCMEDRSDGFKRFISMLLILSCENDRNKIFIIDEPDAFLYPTSAKNLRKELINLGKTSIIFYSTHSPFMIDNNALGVESRHIIVEKKNGITYIPKDLTKANYVEDELILRAIGSTIFDRIKDKNILFEGYTDYKLFHKFKNDRFSEYGSLYICGITDINKIIPMMIMTNTKFIIVADSDETSNNKLKEFKKNFPSYENNWLSYSGNNKKINTLEDFYKREYIEHAMRTNGYDDFSLSDDKMFNVDNIKKYIEKRIDKKDKKNILKDMMREIKRKLVEQAKKENIEEDYFTFLDKLKESLKKL